jgi:hypothetical protein
MQILELDHPPIWTSTMDPYRYPRITVLTLRGPQSQNFFLNTSHVISREVKGMFWLVGCLSFLVQHRKLCPPLEEPSPAAQGTVVLPELVAQAAASAFS